MLESPAFTTQLAASAERLFQLMNRFSQAQVLVVGDLTANPAAVG